MAKDIVDRAKDALHRFHGDSLQGVLLRTDNSKLDATERELKDIYRHAIPNKDLIEEDFDLLMRSLELLSSMIINSITLIRFHYSKHDESRYFKDAALAIASKLENIGGEDLARYIYAQFDMVPTFVPMMSVNNDDDIDW